MSESMYGHPDDEPRGIPHGEVLVNVTNVTASVAPGYLEGPFSIAAYQSVVVVAANYGGADMTVEVGFDFEGSLGDTFSNRIRTVLAGTTQRFLFQSRGDQISGVLLRGVGADVQADLYVQGSNLLPFSGVGDWAALYSRDFPADPTQTIPNGMATILDFAQAISSGGGITASAATDQVVIVDPGLYLAVASVSWPGAPGAFYHYTIPAQLAGAHVASNIGPHVPGQPSDDGSAVALADEGINLYLVDQTVSSFPLNCTVYQTSGGNKVLNVARSLWVVRIGAEP